MNDKRSQIIIKNFNKSSALKRILKTFCYFIIFIIISSYFLNFFKSNKKITIIKNAFDASQKIEVEKIMINPRISILHDDGKIYKISAQKAYHLNEKEVIMEDVFASSEIGNISAGELKISDEGNHLIFTKNPVLIFND